MEELLASIGTNVEMIHIVLFALGMICLIAEMFQPGFGFFGLSGIALIVCDIVVLADSLAQAAILVTVLVLILLFLILLFFILVSCGVVPKKLKLDETVGDGNSKWISNEMKVEIGDTGTAVTSLRPVGKAVFGDRTIVVVSNGEFIDCNASVVVSEIIGNRIVVKRS